MHSKIDSNVSNVFWEKCHWLNQNDKTAQRETQWEESTKPDQTSKHQRLHTILFKLHNYISSSDIDGSRCFTIRSLSLGIIATQKIKLEIASLFKFFAANLHTRESLQFYIECVWAARSKRILDESWATVHALADVGKLAAHNK